ncbi:SixA phosphatase family protein [Roseivirga spongicola]|uniref:SixA phosphatase family protein n=1 Tax=Roseivirga spongicola TaxID=333140 RepID=UPI002AC9083B|nr:phosphoglycerate mutase family protein [Roseivirga spongicola]WPZ09726.1 phosphoglycerate mutase family protein [Roseivirga spongicola]
MKKILVLCFLLGLAISQAFAQNDLTTFILVRHAEKSNDDPRDPSLSAEGETRAQKLAEVLAEQDLAAIYSTPFKRTRTTAEPLAQAKGLTVNVYDFRSQTYLQDMLKKHKGSTILISGHSNTTPMVANILLGSEKFKQLDEKEYGMIFIVTVSEIGKGTVTVLKY